LQIRAVHIGAIIASGALFALRGIGVLTGAHWPMAAPLRYISYSVDTVLLTAALMLVTMLPATLFANHWLTAKLTLLVIYVVLGSLALKRARTKKVRAICFVAAIALYLCIYSKARTYQPLGWLTS
jgi:uncharacterized membrane protein SirB2